MPNKIILDEEWVLNEYALGKSSLIISDELKVSKQVVLKILKKHNVTRKKDRCKCLNIKQIDDRFVIYRKCPSCNEDSIISTNHPTTTCRNYYNAINKKTLCKKCYSIFQTGENNPFYGKKHSQETKTKISDSRTGKYTGDQNHMKKQKYRDHSRDHMKSLWDNNILDKKTISDKLKETRRLGKIKSIIRSKKEKEIIEEIKNLGYKVTHSLRIDTKICDIYIESLNLIIEYNGDYWHCNPKKYESDYFHQIKGKTAKELWEYDQNKIDLIRNNGYNLEIVWESDLKEDHNLINKLIKKYDKQ